MKKRKLAIKMLFASFAIVLGLFAPDNVEAALPNQESTQAEVFFSAVASDALTIYSAPNLHFGNRTIALDARYYPHYDSGSDAQVVINDIRGSKAGWRVELDLSDFTAGADKLTGATITFRSPTVTSAVVPAPAPGPHLGGNSMVSSVVLSAGSGVSQVLLTAPTGAGMATTTFSWASASSGSVDGYTSPQSGSLIELMVPAGAALSKAYTANLTWQLVDAP